MFSKCVEWLSNIIFSGKKDIITESNKTFISSTYWSERIGSTAALATIKEMERIKSWDIIKKKGNFIRKEILKLAKNKVKIIFNESYSIIYFEIIGKYEPEIYKNFITEEMLKKLVIANTTIYVSVSHTNQIIKKYLSILNEIFKKFI